MTDTKSKIIIVGAGLCGSLLAVTLAQRGFRVVVYEKLWDMRKEEMDAGRSINLALSARGLMALDRVGLREEVQKDCIPMRARMIHPRGGESFKSPYSGRAEDYINSVSRPGLNKILLDATEAYPNVELRFNCKVREVDLENAKIKYQDKEGNFHSDEGSVVIGTDGAGSAVRRSMMGHTTRLLFNYEQDFLRHGYKELSILPGDNGDWKIEKEVLHIWPNGSFMIIALPNLDGSFTLTMFHPYEGEAGFNTLNSPDKVSSFFEKYYPSLLPYIPHLTTEYFENPTGTLGTIKCYPWQAYGKTLIMGDASHAIVPFYGQGMNSSLEDVRVFDDLLQVHGDDWQTLFSKFQDFRQPNADAIADLAIDNFTEMRDHVNDQNFKRKRKIEMQLEQKFPDYYSKYSLVTFRPQLSYEEAMKKGRLQDKLLLELCSRADYEQRPLDYYHEQLMKIS
jgi:kynurenine 3-monooxygenase